MAIVTRNILNNSAFVSGDNIGWTFTSNLGSSLAADAGQTLYWKVLTFIGSEVSIRLSSTPTEEGLDAGPDFSAQMEQSGTITFVASDGERLVVTGISDSSEPYSWTPSNSSEVSSFRAHVIALTNRSLTVTFDDTPPVLTTVVVEAGPNRTIESEGSITIEASVQVENAVGATTYQWTKLSGSGGSLDNSQILQPTFTSPTVTSQRSYIYRLTVTNNNISDNDTVTIIVNPPGQTTVVANAGPDIEVTSGESVVINASVQVANGQGVTTYGWVISSGSGGSLNNTSILQPTFTASVVTSIQTIMYRLGAQNNSVGDFDFVTITVNPTTPVTPIISVTVVLPQSGTPQSASILWILDPYINLGDELSADGLDIYLESVSLPRLTQSSGDAVIIRLASTLFEAPNIRNDFSDAMEQNGTITFVASDGETLVITDISDAIEPYRWRPSNLGEVSAFANHVAALSNRTLTITFSVESAGITIVTIQTPNQTIDGGDTVQLEATVTNPPGITSTLLWDVPVDTGSFSDATIEDPTWTANSELHTTAYYLRLTATNSEGNVAQASVLITVTGTNQPPIVTIQTQPQTIDGNITLQLNATIIDDSTIDTILWTGMGTFSAINIEDPMWLSPSPTIETDYDLTLVVTDNFGLMGTATVTITVDPVIIIPPSASIRLFNLDILNMYFIPAVPYNGSEGSWQNDAGGSTSSSGTGPGTNSISTATYVYSETSGSSIYNLTSVRSILTVRDAVMADWIGSGRILAMRLSIAGNWSTSGEGFRVQGREVDGDNWETIHLIRGWDYSNTLNPGDTFTDVDGNDLINELHGGWVTFEVTIPDAYTQVRIGSVLIAGSIHQHDVAMRDVEFRDGTTGTPITRPEAPNAPALLVLGTDTISVISMIPNDGGSPILSYDLRYRVLGTGIWSEILGNASINFTITELLPNTEYEVQTRATNVIDDSLYSPSATAITNPLVNIPPTVVIDTSDQMVEAGALLQILATTEDTDGTIVSLLWTGTGVFDNPVLEDVEWTAPMPEMETVYTLTLTATDNNGVEGADTINITVSAVVIGGVPVLPTVSDQISTIGIPVNIQLPEAMGGEAPLSYTVVPLPDGLDFNELPTSRYITGIPTVIGVTTIMYTVIDNLNQTSTITFTFTIEAAGPVTPGIVIDTEGPWNPGSRLESATLNAMFWQVLNAIPGGQYTGRVIRQNYALYRDTGTSFDLIVTRAGSTSISALRRIGTNNDDISAGNHPGH